MLHSRSHKQNPIHTAFFPLTHQIPTLFGGKTLTYTSVSRKQTTAVLTTNLRTQLTFIPSFIKSPSLRRGERCIVLPAVSPPLSPVLTGLVLVIDRNHADGRVPKNPRRRGGHGQHRLRVRQARHSHPRIPFTRRASCTANTKRRARKRAPTGAPNMLTSRLARFLFEW